MRKLIIVLTSVNLIAECLKDSKNANVIISSVKKEFISQRHLHEKIYGDFNFKNEREWDSLNFIS